MEKFRDSLVLSIQPQVCPPPHREEHEAVQASVTAVAARVPYSSFRFTAAVVRLYIYYLQRLAGRKRRLPAGSITGDRSK